MSRDSTKNGSVANFRAHAEDGFYDGTIFHRVVVGREVVDRIKAIRTATRNSQSNVPVEDVKILAIRRK